MLEDASFAVTLAPDGAAALACFERGRFDALLTDIRMPGMSGLELVGALRRGGSEIPVVALSGDISPAEARQLRALGVAEEALLVKATRLSRVAQTIRASLQAPVSASLQC